MNAALASSAARPLIGGVASTRSRTTARGRTSGGGRVATVRAATLNLARTADDLKAGSVMTASARRFRAAADVESPNAAGGPRTSHRCVCIRSVA